MYIKWRIFGRYLTNVSDVTLVHGAWLFSARAVLLRIYAWFIDKSMPGAHRRAHCCRVWLHRWVPVSAGARQDEAFTGANQICSCHAWLASSGRRKNNVTNTSAAAAHKRSVRSICAVSLIAARKIPARCQDPLGRIALCTRPHATHFSIAPLRNNNEVFTIR